MQQSNDICIIGASVRAAAHSAIRAGFQPRCADLFADRDLCRVASCHCVQQKEYPYGLQQILDYSPWIYTGALENYPALLDAWSNQAILYGNCGPPLVNVRDPNYISALFSRSNIPGPRIVTKTTSRPFAATDNRRWLLKPIRSAGGRGIQFWNGKEVPNDWYLQEFVSGESQSAVFICSESATWFVGVTRQLVGESWLNALPFHYCGSIGPITDDQLVSSWQKIGTVLADAGLRGLVGVDAIVKEDRVIPIEVNPRYTASVEVLELAQRISLVNVHAIEFGHIVRSSYPNNNMTRTIGKAIYYAPSDFEFSKSGPWEVELHGDFDPWRTPLFADIPGPGTVFSKGEPVMTVFAEGATVSECEWKLQERADELGRLIQ